MTMNSEPKPYPSIFDYVRVIKTNRLLIAFVAVLCGGAALAYSRAQKPTYTATAALIVRDQSQDLALLGNPQTPTPPDVLAAEHAGSVLRQAVLNLAARALSLTPSQVHHAVSVSVEPQTNFVDVAANGSSAGRAAQIANEVANDDATLTTSQERADLARAARAFAARSAALSKSSDPTTRTVYNERLANLVALSSVATPVAVQLHAQPPSSASSPKTARNTGVGLCIGLIIGLLLAFLRNATDRKLRDAHEVVELMGLPLLGHVHADTLGIGRYGTKTQTQFDPRDMETFRILRQGVNYLARSDTGAILVTSPLASEGKSTVALGLAMVNAAAGKRTLLIECDLRRPVLASRTGIQRAPGLSQYLAGEAEPGDILQSIPVSSLLDVHSLPCITAGDLLPEPADLLGSERFAEFMREVRLAYEVIIVDSTPLLSVADALEIVPHCDRVLVCVRAHQTTRQESMASMGVLRRLPSRPTGVVVTGIRDRDAGDYGYYSYGVASGPDGTTPARVEQFAADEPGTPVNGRAPNRRTPVG